MNVIDGTLNEGMADAALAAAVSGAHAGTLVGDLTAAGVAAAQTFGGAAGPPFRLRIDQVGGGERLRKSALLVVRMYVGSVTPEPGLHSDYLQSSRTLVVGFDTLAADALAADRAVRALAAAASAARAGATPISIGLAVRSLPGDATVLVERRPVSDRDRTHEAMATGELVFIEASVGDVVLGDTIRVTATHGEPVGALALRLWL
jgi:hypothetical protein